MFRTSDEKRVMATKYHTGLLTYGFDMKGVDVALKWATSALDAPTTLLYLALYEQHTTSRFDVFEATQKSLVSPSTMGADKPASDRPDIVIVECEIDVLERRIAELRGPRVPPLTLVSV